MFITDAINGIVNWIADFSQGDVIAVVILFVAIALAFTTIKTALKIAMVVVGVLAVMYLVAPDVYGYAIDLIEKIIEGASDFFASVKN